MNSPDMIMTVLQKYPIIELVQTAQHDGWTNVWQQFNNIREKASFKDESEKNIFIDLFFSQCLRASPTSNQLLFLEIVQQWLKHRRLENRCGSLSHHEKISLIRFSKILRDKMQEFLTQTPLTMIETLTDDQQNLLITLWKKIFLEPFSAINLYWKLPSHPSEVSAADNNKNYIDLIITSMYQPFSAAEYEVDAKKLLSSSLPFCYKAILIYWLVNTPYFNADENHRQKLLHYVPELCNALTMHQEVLSLSFFLSFVQEVMTGFWRASYIGGNNVTALSSFGDLIHATITKFINYPKPIKTVRKNPEKGEKIRIGYISRNFYKQAVSCYMVNRVIHHDQDKFEVHVFALGDYHDEISDLFKKHSDSFKRFTNITEIAGIVKSIIEKNLDILVYTDIGMDPITYILSGIQLAPIQCAMVGHGTTTGMPTIQYYLSGDFEPPNAENHYREKLIRLPNLGAAQYMPINPKKKLTRQDLGIPEDAIVFVSCANGIKHGKLRDSLFVDILKKAPNAWIVLKPFAIRSSIDNEFATRIVSAAKLAGVADRLIILPPIGQTSHVMGLLAIADAQLDTFPYGGWTTNMEALYMGLPIVTQEGELARSRWGAGMLKALGICEGIASNEEEYVAWAVKFAQSPELLGKLKKHINEHAKHVLFNGAASQPSFDNALIKIYDDYFSQTAPNSQYKKYPHSRYSQQDIITIATSLTSDKNSLENQQIALESWKNAGFNVVSINSLEDAALLRPHFPDIDFIAVRRDAKNNYGKSYIYFDDILTYFSNINSKICGIITPDIYLSAENFPAFIYKQSDKSLLYGSRVDVEQTAASYQGHMYTSGFDYFFFDRKIIQYYPKQDFCIGLPWWDYWTVLVPLMYKLPVKKIINPLAYHISHPPTWNKKCWTSLGFTLAQHFHPPFALTAENMHDYLSDTLSIINKLSLEISL